MQAVAITAVLLGVVGLVLMCGGYVLEGTAGDYECDTDSYLSDNYSTYDSQKYSSSYEHCYEEQEELAETSSFVYGIGFSFAWFSLILAIASNRLE
tara:strand:+ start:313 stop:600 length:288 start_codon:yes stop_codon:yes gene_type:complete